MHKTKFGVYFTRLKIFFPFLSITMLKSRKLQFYGMATFFLFVLLMALASTTLYSLTSSEMEEYKLKKQTDYIHGIKKHLEAYSFLSPEILTQQIESFRPSSVTYVKVENGKDFNIFTGVQEGGEVIKTNEFWVDGERYTIEVGYSDKLIDGLKNRIEILISFFIMFALLLGSMAYVLLYRGVINPAASISVVLGKMMNRFKEDGDISDFVCSLKGLRGPSEIRQIAESAAGFAKEAFEKKNNLKNEAFILDERLVKLNAELTHELEAKKRLIARFSHEFNTPIILAMDVIDSASEEDVDLDKVRTLAKLTRPELQDVRDKIYDFLTIEERQKPFIEKVDIFDVAMNLRRELAIFAVKEGVYIDFVKRVDGGFIFDLDRKMIFFALRNLIKNAIKFSDGRGGVRVALSSVYAKGGWNPVLMVSDYGVGIDEGEKKNIFRDGYQVDSGDNRKFGGNGIGLKIVENYCNAMNLKIKVRSLKGRGTTFAIFLAGSRKRWVKGVRDIAESLATAWVDRGDAVYFEFRPGALSALKLENHIKRGVLGEEVLLDGTLENLEEALGMSQGKEVYLHVPFVIEGRMDLLNCARRHQVVLVYERPFEIGGGESVKSVTLYDPPRAQDMSKGEGELYRGVRELLEGMNVLIVEDNESWAYNLRENLEQVGVRPENITHYSSGKDALEGLVEFDVAIIDYSLHGMTGVELVQKLSDQTEGWRDKFVCIDTAHSQEVVKEIADSVKGLGVDLVLPKKQGREMINAIVAEYYEFLGKQEKNWLAKGLNSGLSIDRSLIIRTQAASKESDMTDIAKREIVEFVGKINNAINAEKFNRIGGYFHSLKSTLISIGSGDMDLVGRVESLASVKSREAWEDAKEDVEGVLADLLVAAGQD